MAVSRPTDPFPGPATAREAKEVLGRIVDACGTASTRSCLAALTGALRNLAKALYPDPVERNAKIVSLFVLDHDELTAEKMLRRARQIAKQSRLRRVSN